MVEEGTTPFKEVGEEVEEEVEEEEVGEDGEEL